MARTLTPDARATVEPFGVLGWLWRCQRPYCRRGALGIASTLTEAHTRATAHIRHRHMPVFDVIEQEYTALYARYSVSVAGIPLGNVNGYSRVGECPWAYKPSVTLIELPCTANLEDAARAVIDVSGLMFEGARMVIAEGGRRREAPAAWSGAGGADCEESGKE